MIFFEREPITFEYDKIGIIEVKGNQTATTNDLLNHLKFEAFKNNANTIIAVRDGYVKRESGVLFSKTPPEHFSSHVYTGIAVNIKDNNLLNVPIEKTKLFL